MSNLLTANQEVMKNVNRTLVLDIIRSRGPISRADISRITNLTRATVSSLVAELLTEGLAREVGTGETAMGRKPMMLEFLPGAAYAIGVKVGIHEIRAIATDLDARIIARGCESTPPGREPATIFHTVAHVIQETIQSSGLNEKNIRGVGLGINGIVNHREGISVFAPSFGWRNIKVRELVEQEVNLPVFVENDVRAGTLGEKWFGAGKNVRNLICVFVGSRIGSGIIIENQILRGANEGAGEIGHNTVMIDGPRCQCGNYGCLEVMASGEAIAQRAWKALKQGHQSQLQSLIGGDESKITAEKIAQAAQHGDTLSKFIIEEAAHYLGIAIANAVNLFNPEMVILSGGVSKTGEVLFKPFQETLLQKVLDSNASALKVVPGILGKDSCPLGSAAMVLQQVFKFPKFLGIDEVS